MATDKRSRSRLPRWAVILIVLVAVALIIIAFNWGWLRGQARLGTAYGARIACSCRYVADRPLDACYSDFEPGMETVSLSDDAEERAVTASIPLLASATARYRPGWGCLLDP